MGRITVFTTSGDLNSKQVLKELESRSLPYIEIDLSCYPSKVRDLEAMVGTCSVPHVFFNTRYVGGVKSCIHELKRWDTNRRFYNSLLERYQVEIASAADPVNGRLALPEAQNAALVQEKPAKTRTAQITIQMPDGSTAPRISELYENLKKWLPLRRCTYESAVYNKSFSGRDLIGGIKDAFGLSTSRALRFAEELSEVGIVRHVDSEKFSVCQSSSFLDTVHDIYRLQCHAEPEVLNSYLIWPRDNLKINPTACLEMVDNLDRLLSVMELSSIDPDDGLLNAKHATNLRKFALFEEAACELQALSMNALFLLTENEMTAFALNLFSVMTRYANIKVGVPTSEEDRNHRLKTIKFNLAGETFTLQDWLDVLLCRSTLCGCSNRTEKDCGSTNTSTSHDGDETTGEQLLVKKDKRISMALFIGPHYGSRWSAPFPRYSADNLEQQLEIAARVFCLDDRSVNVHQKDNILELLLPVFGDDGIFGTSKSGVKAKVILPYLIGKKRCDLSTMLVSGDPIKITYREPKLGGHMVPGNCYKRDLYAKPKNTKSLGKGNLISSLKPKVEHHKGIRGSFLSRALNQ